MKKLFLLILLLCGSTVYSQVNVISYTYDAAGNRINRSPTTSSTVAQWTFTGNTRCAVNAGSVNTGNTERQEKDNNASSPTYNQLRWVISGYNTTTCPLPPNWVATGNYRCETDINYENTGNQQQEEKDMNPGSATYNQTRWVFYAYDTTSCPLPNYCETLCAIQGDEYRCVFDICEIGFKVYTSSTYDGYIYHCTYHYEWSDGYWSQDYYEDSYNPCY